MTKEQVLDILKYKRSHSLAEVSVLTNIPISTIRYWIRRAKQEGITVPPNQKPKGRKPLKLN